MKLFALLLQQDDPKRCTSKKLCRFKLAKPLYRKFQIRRGAVVLNPYSPTPLSPQDTLPLKEGGLVVVDCSWERAGEVFNLRLPGLSRRLPLLLAANPTNYGHLAKLSSAEAFSAALYIADFREQSARVLSIFKWGPTFLTLNEEPLKAYHSAKTWEEIGAIEKEFFPLPKMGESRA